MVKSIRLNSKQAAVTAVFTALYAVLGFIKISPILGLSQQGITAAAIVAPIIGILLGPYIGTLSTVLGGVIGFSIGSIGPPSLFAGIATGFCAGMIQAKRRVVSTVTYIGLFLLFAFFPAVGPAWLFPLATWFQILGLVILISPLQRLATDDMNSENNTKKFEGFFLVCLASTLAGQIAGSLIFEALAPDPKALFGIWQALTIVYPIERTIIAVAATLISIPLIKALSLANMIPSNILLKRSIETKSDHT
jgi:hypothetical protein